MKGYRTPSWFRTKAQRKEKQVKAQVIRPKHLKLKKKAKQVIIVYR